MLYRNEVVGSPNRRLLVRILYKLLYNTDIGIYNNNNNNNEEIEFFFTIKKIQFYYNQYLKINNRRSGNIMIRRKGKDRIGQIDK